MIVARHDDRLTRELTGYVLNTKGTFNVAYQTKLEGLFKGPGGKPIKAPKFLFASGRVSVAPRGGRTWAKGAIYVTEITTGQMIALALPWKAGLPATNGKVALEPVVIQRAKVGVGELDE